MHWPTLYTYAAYVERCGGGSPTLPAVWTDHPGLIELYVPNVYPPDSVADLVARLTRSAPPETSVAVRFVSGVPREALPPAWPESITEEGA